MAVFLISSCNIEDPERYATYAPGVMPLLQKHGAQVLAADNELTALEGPARDTTVILKFPSKEAVQNFYDDPEYAPLKEIRLGSTSNGSVLLVKEFVPRSG